MKRINPARNRVRLCALNGAPVDDVRASDLAQVALPGVIVPLPRQPNIFTSYIKKKGELPSPEVADTIGRLLGTPVEAYDGKKYPLPTQDRRSDARKRRETKNAYHVKVKKVSNLRQALACLEAAGEPTALAVHMKSDPEIGSALDLAIEWMTQFAEELRSREQSCC